MHQTKKRAFGLLLTIIILMFSVQYTVMEAESFENIKVSNQQYTTTGNIITEKNISGVEILNTYSLSLRQNLLQQFRMTKKVFRLSWLFLVMPFFYISILKFIIAISFMESPKLQRNKIILQYIHDLDGKK